MITPYRIVWLNQSSLDFDVWTELALDSDQGATSSFLNKEAVVTEHYDGTYRRIHSYKYNEVLTPRITFVKQDYSDFTPEENRKMLSWLTGTQTAGWLEIYHDDSNVMSYRLFGNFATVEQHKMANGRVIGYECEFESNSPYAWSKKMIYPEVIETLEEINNPIETNDYLMISGTEEVALTCNTDEYSRLLFPKVTITFGDDICVPVDDDPTVDDYKMMPYVIYMWNDTQYINIPKYNYRGIIGEFLEDVSKQKSGADTINRYYYYANNKTIYKGVAEEQEDGTATYGWEIVGYVGAGVQIENSYTLNGETKYIKSILTGCAPKETVVLDGTNKVISSTITPFRIIGDDFNWEWVPMAEGKNNITITGNCKIKFEWIEPRKVGSL